MKKLKKILLIFTLALFATVTTVLATAYSFSVSGILENTVDGNTVTREPIYGEAVMGSKIVANVTGINKVSGTNAKGGIRVYVCAKRKNLLGVWSTKKSGYYSDSNQAPSLTNTDDMTIALILSGSKLTRVEWENHTGNTSFYGTFKAS